MTLVGFTEGGKIKKWIPSNKCDYDRFENIMDHMQRFVISHTYRTI